MRAYERLLQYVRYHTTSDENAPEDKCPTTDRQKVLGAALAEELRGLGLADAHMDEFGYVYGTLPANCETDRPILGLIAHMDTAPAASGENVRARIVENYDGGDIVLNAEKNIVMRPAEFESLLDYKGQDLIVTDGTTLLGSDDKAGIAEIFTTLERLVAENIPHGTIKVGITPDEETLRCQGLWGAVRLYGGRRQARRDRIRELQRGGRQDYHQRGERPSGHGKGQNEKCHLDRNGIPFHASGF